MSDLEANKQMQPADIYKVVIDFLSDLKLITSNQSVKIEEVESPNENTFRVVVSVQTENWGWSQNYNWNVKNEKNPYKEMEIDKGTRKVKWMRRTVID